MEQHSKQSETPYTEPAQLLKAGPLAKILNCGTATVYALARRGKIPCVTIGKAGVRFIPEDVIAALTRRAPK